MAYTRYVQYVPHCHRQGRDWRSLRHWSWAKALTERLKLMTEGRPVPARLEGDVPTLPTAAEVRWAAVFYARIGVDDWCCRLAQFHDRCFVDLPAFDAAAQSSPTLRKQRDVRRWRHRLQALLFDYMCEGDVRTDKTGRTSL